MKIDTARVEAGDEHMGDDKRFVVQVISERVIIPRELKEQRAALVQQIADIDATLAKLEIAKEEIK